MVAIGQPRGPGIPSGLVQGGDDMAVTGVSRFERFFGEAAGLDVDKNDLKRHVPLYSFVTLLLLCSRGLRVFTGARNYELTDLSNGRRQAVFARP
jgi:hypothetical protein